MCCLPFQILLLLYHITFYRQLFNYCYLLLRVLYIFNFYYSLGSRLKGFKMVVKKSQIHILLCHHVLAHIFPYITQFYYFSPTSFSYSCNFILTDTWLYIKVENMKDVMKHHLKEKELQRISSVFLWIWTHLLKKSLMENFIFCAAFPVVQHPPKLKITTLRPTQRNEKPNVGRFDIMHINLRYSYDTR